MTTLTLGPVELAPNPAIIVDVVAIEALPLATYRFCANGVEIPAVEYVILVGAPNAPPDVPVTNVSLVGYMLPLNLFTSNVTSNAFVLS